MESLATVKSTKESIDPLFHLVSKDLELVFQHFDNRDVLNASLVSRNWYDVTESSSKCGERLLLIMKGKVVAEVGSVIRMANLVRFIPLKFKTIASDFKSVRRYQRLDLGSFDENIHFIIPDISNVLRRWTLKEVYIDNIHFKNVEQMEDFLSIFASTVVILKLRNAFKMSANPRNKKLAFPVLKHLNICDNTLANFSNDISDSCKTLESFNFFLWVGFEEDYVWRSIEDAVRKILSRNDNLIDLRVTIYDSEFPEFFSPEAISSYRFRLKKLCISGIRHADFFLNFIVSQAETLEELFVDRNTNLVQLNELFKIVVKFPKLKVLQVSIRIYNPSAWVIEELCQSSSIEEFALNVAVNASFNDIAPILNMLMPSFPNLKTFCITSLTHELLENFKNYFRQIEHLWVHQLTIETLEDPNCFPNIKSLHCEMPIDLELQSQIEAKPHESRSPFENLLLDHTVSKKFFRPPKDKHYEWLLLDIEEFRIDF